jgi:hypothetical protein
VGEERVHVFVDPLVLPPGALEMVGFTSHLETLEECDDRVVVADVAVGGHAVLVALRNR